MPLSLPPGSLPDQPLLCFPSPSTSMCVCVCSDTGFSGEVCVPHYPPSPFPLPLPPPRSLSCPPALALAVGLVCPPPQGIRARTTVKVWPPPGQGFGNPGCRPLACPDCQSQDSPQEIKGRGDPNLGPFRLLGSWLSRTLNPERPEGYSWKR